MSHAGTGAKAASGLLAELGEAVSACRRCTLGAYAAQALGGTGQVGAQLMLVLEGPSHEADLSGQALAGPSGRLLAEALVHAELSSDDVYVTHAVRHFAWRAKGARRLARRPTRDELMACRSFLAAEVSLIAPRLIVALGVSAARSVLGQGVALKEARTHVFQSDLGPSVVTHQPAAIVRLAKGLRARALAELMHDLRAAKHLAQKLEGQKQPAGLSV